MSRTRMALSGAVILLLAGAPLAAQTGSQQQEKAVPDSTRMMSQCPHMEQGEGMMQSGMMKGGMKGMMGKQGGMMQGGMMQGGMMQGGMMQGGMMGMMVSPAPAPGMLLKLQEKLGLTEEQVERLEALKTESSEAFKTHMKEAMDARKRAKAALEGEVPDLGAYEQALREVQEHMVEAQMARLRAALEGRDLLTPEQRELLKERGGMMKGGMMKGGMMKGGDHESHHPDRKKGGGLA